MDKINDSTEGFLIKFRRVLWPIESGENKKFVPMALMMFFILLNFATLRSLKDGFVVTAIGAEAISFLKFYIVIPSAIIAMIIYTKLYNIMSQQKVFYTITSFFMVYLVVFAFVFYPRPEFFHLNPETVSSLSVQLPYLKWFIKIAGNWTFATLYVIAELWSGLMVSLLFWQFANQITKTEEAKRFYSMFGVLGNVGLLACGGMMGYFLSNNVHIVSDELKFIPIFIVLIISCIATMLLYNWINKNVLTDPNLYSPKESKSGKGKVKMPLKDSFKMIFTSKYLGLIALLVLTYGISVNLVEGIWKSKIKELYPTKETYTMFMAQFQAWQGITAMVFMIIGTNIIRKVSWRTAAILSPIMMLLTGVAFFCFIFFKDNFVGEYFTAYFGLTSLALAVIIGAMQNILSKATKYSLFDATKEMAYIPLDDEIKAKGKAAVDVVGGRFGKSGGGAIQSTFFLLLPSFTFNEATPYFAAIFFVMILIWIYAVCGLSKEYSNLVKDHTY